MGLARFGIWLLAANLLLLQPLAAKDLKPEPEAPPQAEAMARKSIESLLRALQGFLGGLPHYGLPRINERGDIVIPRIEKKEPPSADREEENIWT